MTMQPLRRDLVAGDWPADKARKGLQNHQIAAAARPAADIRRLVSQPGLPREMLARIVNDFLSEGSPD